MNNRGVGTWRRTRRHGVVIGIVVMMAALVGCSAGGDYGSEADNAVAYDEAPAADAGSVDEQAAEDGGATRADNRAVVVTGALYMTVDDPMEAADRAVDIVDRAGGRVDARAENAPEDDFGGSAVLTLRIPTDDLEDVVDDLRELGAVDEFTTDSVDVTNQVIDLESRISTLRESTKRIEGLLADAVSISDIITLENELASRQAELESLEAQQRGLDDQVSMSTIELSLTTEPVEIVVEDEGPQNFWDGFVSGWNGLVGFISAALIVLGLMLPWLALIGVIVAAVIVPLRLRAKRAARREPVPAPAPAALSGDALVPPPAFPSPPKK